MNKKICLLVIILFMSFLAVAKTGAQFQVLGVKGKLLTNITARLGELAANNPLASSSNEALQQHIEKAMYPYGFFKPQIQISREGNSYVTISIQPGPKLLINRLSINIIGEGKNNPEIIKALQSLPIKQGDPFNSTQYEEAKQLLADAAEHEGYLHSAFDKAEVLINKDNYTSSITLIFNTGIQYYFGQLRFNPSYIAPELLRRYVPFQYGQPYSTNQILAFNDSLSGSGYFKSVSVKPADNGNKNIPVDVYLENAARVNYSFGLGYGTDTGPRGQAGLHIVPVNRLGHKFNAIALGSFNENTIKTQYIIPGNNPLINQYEINSSLSTYSYDAGYSNSMLVSLAQRHHLPKYQRVLSLNNLYERFNYSNQPKEESYSFFPRAKLTWLNKSEQLFSPNGYKVSVNGFIANNSVLSQINFAQTSIDAKAALTLESLGTRFYFHTLLGITQINNIDEFPLSLALLLGGSDNLKGYEYNSIGPGKIAQYGGFEIQKEIKPKWYLVSFFDTGDVYKPSIKSTKNDIGLGLMWVSPIGPIKIGLAEPVDNHFHRMPGRNPRLVINMGPDL